MESSPKPAELPPDPPLAELKPYLSITVLELVAVDPDAALGQLEKFLRQSADDRGRTTHCQVRSGFDLLADDIIDTGGRLRDFGFDRIFGVSRQVTHPPGWATKESGIVDVENQLTLVLRRRGLVAVNTSITSEAKLRRWVDSHGELVRFIPADVLAGTFRGNGRMVWMRGVSRPRTTRPNSRALTGIRLQDALNPLEDNNFILSAAKVDHVPEDEDAVLRNQVTFSPDKSKISWRQTPDFPVFLRATAEVLDKLDKALVAEAPPPLIFGGLAVRETDLRRVRFAVDIAVADPDQLRGESDANDDEIERAELLNAVTFDVRGEPGSAVAELDVTAGSATATFRLRPVEVAGGFRADVRQLGSTSVNPVLAQIEEAISDGGLVTIYYGTGHAFDGRRIHWRDLVDTPFTNIRFEDFSGFAITREKPEVKGDQAIHNAIGADDDSLFGWVVHRFRTDWLLCDDGAGEVADFLHLADEGTLTAIHVKAALSDSPGRRIAVTGFEQVVSQAEKNVTSMRTERLLKRLSPPRIPEPAAWHDGRRAGHAEFVEQLRMRLDSDPVRVIIVQPHLMCSVHDLARRAVAAGQENRDTHSLRLLDNLLHSTRRTITGQCDDLTVIGSTE